MTARSGEDGRRSVDEASAPAPRWGIRRRILVVYLVLLAVALLMSFAVSRQALRARLDGQIEEGLAQEVQELRTLTAVGIDPETGQPFGDDVEAILSTFLSRSVPEDHEAFYTLIEGRPHLVSFGAPEELLADGELVARWAATVEPRTESAMTELGEVRYLATPLVADGAVSATFVVVYFPTDDYREIDAIFRLEAVVGLAVFGAAAVVAWTAAGRIVQPVRALTDMARSITETDLSARLPISGRDELTELGETFNEMLARLEAGFTGQRQFLDDVAHELRTPITIVQGHLELLGDDPAEREETLELVQDELNRMRRYVSDLLLLAKAEGSDFLRPVPVDVGELAATLHQKVGALGDQDWRLETAPSPGSLAIVADPERLSQAVINLAGNAVEHTIPGAEIGLGFEPAPRAGQPTGVRIWVRDRGNGLEPGLAERVFDRRQRGAASRRRRRDGLGIGLSIVDAVVRAHGGTVSARNRPDGGARFDIELPGEPLPAVDVRGLGRSNSLQPSSDRQETSTWQGS
ncbi:MAG: HAMP domain-containing sensor histidine kinase [Actinomycetota bacterium]